MTTKYRLTIQVNKETFTWEDRLYSVPPGTKAFNLDVSEGELIEKLRSLVPSNQLMVIKVERL